MKQIDGWWVPDWWTEKDFAAYSAKFDATLDKALEYCQLKRTVVMAGDSIGYWSKRLAKDFRWVLTFEPVLENFECMVRNLEGLQNVDRLQACLGHKHRPLEMKKMRKGDHWVVAQGKLVQFPIDKLDQQPIDLILLNTAGYEYFILDGAGKNFHFCHPVVVYENHKKWKDLHGKPEDGCEKILKKAGFEVKAKVENHLIWDKKNKPVMPK
jgi:FkbM family methyltransferase